MSGSSDPYPRSVEEIYDDYSRRRSGIHRALTDEVDDFYQQCDPDRDNLCLYGERNGNWTVDLPAEEVPPELPEPCLGINFARDGMARKDWLALVAVHSDAWLMAVAFFYAVKLDQAGRNRLFKLINQFPTLFEVVTGRSSRAKQPAGAMPGNAAKPSTMNMSGKNKPVVGGLLAGGVTATAKASRNPLPTGRLLQYPDIKPELKGRQAELFWPDDALWYLVEIAAVNMRNKTAKIIYTTGEQEDLDLDEIVRDGHMSLITQ